MGNRQTIKGQTIQWAIDKGQTIQWTIDKGQTIQWTIDKGQTIEWPKDRRTDNTMAKRKKYKRTNKIYETYT
jgi:hypothetical protein